ncbi:hypothetical protein QOT17_011459 [Balamuthia mandrillaris]
MDTSNVLVVQRPNHSNGSCNRETLGEEAWGQSLEQSLQPYVEVCYLKVYLKQGKALVILPSIEAATIAKDILTQRGHAVAFGPGTEESTLCASRLSIPPQEKAFLLSPPPSPPDSWVPIHEGINRVPFVDLSPEDDVLLPATQCTPTIRIDVVPSTTTTPSTPTRSIPRTRHPLSK